MRCRFTARLFVDHLRHDFRRAFEDLSFVDDVYLRVDFARVGDESCLGCDRDLFGDRSELEHDCDSFVFPCVT